jgi:acetyl-CoA carboxylase carboxyl transferase subunit alpha
LKFEVIDEIVREPLGGAHRNHKQAAIRMKKSLRKNLERLTQIPLSELIQLREKKFREMGKFVEEAH